MTDLRRLQYFVAVARERNFTRAAERLHIAQPALSRQVRLLEQELGVELLHRTTHEFELTEAGKFLLERGPACWPRPTNCGAASARYGTGERGDGGGRDTGPVPATRPAHGCCSVSPERQPGIEITASVRSDRGDRGRRARRLDRSRADPLPTRGRRARDPAGPARTPGAAAAPGPSARGSVVGRAWRPRRRDPAAASSRGATRATTTRWWSCAATAAWSRGSCCERDVRPRATARSCRARPWRSWASRRRRSCPPSSAGCR